MRASDRNLSSHSTYVSLEHFSIESNSVVNNRFYMFIQ